MDENSKAALDAATVRTRVALMNFVLAHQGQMDEGDVLDLGALTGMLDALERVRYADDVYAIACYARDKAEQIDGADGIAAEFGEIVAAIQQPTSRLRR